MVCALTSPFGPLWWQTDSDGALVRMAFGENPEAIPGFDAVAGQLQEYFAGTRRQFDLELRPAGTPFQLQVWEAVVAIPFGETRTYGQLAVALGRPGAARAVGAANGANPICPVIPCHRVVGSHGALTGYAFGMSLKRALLDLEAGVRPLLC
jgi:methylated-DNA-[protein]-cysteine S-methyltransferase